MKTKPFLLTWLRFAALGLAATALAQPIITTQPRTQFQWENKRVSLNVTTTGSSTPFRYQWQFNGSDLAGATNRVFSLPQVQLPHDGEYRVVITDTAGGVTTSEVARVMVRAWPAPTGPAIPDLARLDTNMESVMLVNNVPGGSLAVVKDGRLVLARGYGFADVENNKPFQPDSLCRGASLSKTITAATALKLVEEGKLDLDATVLSLLNLTPPTYPGAAFDARWTNITVRQALHHTGGWDRQVARDPLGAVGFDPGSWPNQIVQDLGLSSDATVPDLITWMLGRPLQFRPGTAFSYSNLGFDIVGAVIEQLNNLDYETTARRLLAEAGITRMRLTGNTRLERKPAEAVYYLHPSITSKWARDWVEPRPFDFDVPYAWPYTPLLGASSGWLISAIDYARFVAAIDGQPSYPDILAPATIATMVARPSSPSTSGDGYFGLGWDSISPSTGVWLKGGSDAGWRSYSAKYKNGIILVLTLNTYWEALSSYQLWLPFSVTLDGIRQWPAHDLFPATLSYDAWQAKQFTSVELGDSTISGDDSDPDGDGISNLWEYATGTDPHATSEPPRLAASVVEGDSPALSLTYRRLLLAHEVEYTLEDSADLIHWSPTAVEQGDPELNADGTVTARATANVSQPGRFFRLRISRKAQ